MDAQANYKYLEILKTRDIYIELISSLDIGKHISQHNRIFSAYKFLEDISGIYKDKIKLAVYLKKRGFENSYPAILAELIELRFIFTGLKSLQREEVLAQKLILMSSGSLNPLDETPKNNVPRNTQFELALLCDFLNSGLTAELSRDNPDIKLTLDGEVYNIECKRITSPLHFKKNYKKARNQLIQYYKKNKNGTGIIAISISKMFHESDMALMSTRQMTKSEYMNSVNKYMDQSMTAFIKSHSNLWLTDEKLRRMNIRIVLLHYQGILLGRGQTTGATSIRTFTNADNDQEWYSQFLSSVYKTDIPMYRDNTVIVDDGQSR